MSETTKDSSAYYPIPAGQHRKEIIDRGSRFIATAGLAESVEEARALIASVKAEFPDASHHVYAFAVGFGASVTHGMSDDGEPSGTAGRPSLAVVRGSGLGDVCVVTTRYFGGTKLGTGGLVRAYTQAAQAVLESLPRAMHETREELQLRVPYDLYERVKRILAAAGCNILSEDFSADITMNFDIAGDDAESLAEELREMSAGRLELNLSL